MTVSWGRGKAKRPCDVCLAVAPPCFYVYIESTSAPLGPLRLPVQAFSIDSYLQTSAMPQVQHVNFEDAVAKTCGSIKMQVATLSGATGTKTTIPPNGSWSRDLKSLAGTDSCRKAHVGVLLQGRMGVRMDDGNEVTINANEFFIVPPGHDA